jgi:tetratricopeptide (TPR) repeat protein
MHVSSRWRAVSEALPGLVALAVFVVWANNSGGFFPGDWYPGALLLAAMLGVLLLTWRDLVRGHSRMILVAVGTLTGFVVWSYLSIAWAEVKGDAWDGANRSALYLIVFVLFALWRWTTPAKLLVLGGFALGIAALGLWTLLQASRAADPQSYFADGNLIAPVLYRNGNAALLLMAFWPALLLASRRESPAVLRPVFLAAAGVVVELAVLAQSRGAAVAFLLVLAAYFAVVPDRLRSLAFFLPIAATLALVFGRLLDASNHEPPELATGADRAADTVLWSALALLVVGAVLAAVDRRLTIPARTAVLVRRAVVALAAAAGVVALALAASTLDPVARAESAWAEFKGDVEPASPGEARLLRGFDTNRPDLWRVAWEEFLRHPVTGIGSENYGVSYTRERRSEEETLYPHSLEAGVLVQTGIVGTFLFVAFLVAALAAALAARTRGTGADRGATSVAVVVFAYWFAHGSIDWFWELPALAAPAFAFLGLAGSDPPAATPVPSGRRDRVAAAAAAGLVAVVCLSFVFPWLSARHATYATSVWRVDYEAAMTAVDRARSLNPLTDAADLVAGSIERRRRDWDAMARAYERALDRNPHSWYSHLQLALARANQGRRAEAASELAEARRLNPREPLLDLVAGWLRRGEPVDADEVADVLLTRHAGVTGAERPPEPTRKP